MTLLFYLWVSLPVEVHLLHKPLPNQSVKVLKFKSPQAPPVQEEKKTNQEGRVWFNLKSKESVNFFFLTEYEGVAYLSSLFHSQHPPQKPIILTVYPTTSDTRKLEIQDLTFFVSWRGNVLQMEQEAFILNPLEKTVVGETLSFNLPAQTFNLQLGAGFQEEMTHMEGNTLLIKNPIQPGITRFQWSYSLEKVGRIFAFSQNWSVPIQQIHLASSIPDLSLSSFQKSGLKFYEGKQVQTWVRLKLNAKEVQFKMGGLPWSLHWPQVLPGILVIFFGLMIFLFNRKKRIGVPPDKEALLQELLVLKRLHQAGHLPEALYQQKRILFLEDLVHFYDEEKRPPS